MMKFFRKYNKPILWGMAILMMLFLIPELFRDRGGGGRGPTWGTVHFLGRQITVTQSDVVASQNELYILRLAPGVFQQAVMPYLGGQTRGNLDARESETWFLWGQLCDLYGIEVTPAERQAFFDDNGVSGEVRNRAARQSNIALDAVDRSFDQVIALQKLTAIMQQTAGTISEHEIRLAVRDLSERAQVNLVTPAPALIRDLLPPPTDEQMLKQFDQFKDRPRDTGGPFPGGYRIAAKVAVEMLVVDSEELVKNPKLLRIDEMDAYGYYLRHKDRYKVPASQPQTQAAGEPDQAAPPEAGQPQYRPYEEVAEQVLRDMAGEPDGPYNAQAKARAIAEKVLDLALKVQKEGQALYYGSFEERSAGKPTLAEQIEKSDGVGPQVIRTPLFAADELDKLAAQDPLEKRTAETLIRRGESVGADRKELLKVAFQAEPLFPAGQAPPDALELNSQAPEVFAAAGSFFIWRLVEAQPARPPASLDEVRQQVIDDLQTRACFDKGREAIKQVEGLLGQGTSLADAVDRVNAQLNRLAPPASQPDTQAASQPEVPDYLALQTVELARKQIRFDQRQIPYLQWIVAMLERQGRSKEQAQREAFMSITYIGPMEGYPTDVVSAAFQLAADAKPDGAPAERQPARLIENESLGLAALEQFVSLTPANTRDYVTLRPTVLQLLKREAQQRFQSLWLNPAELRMRLGYTSETRTRDEEE